MDNSTTQIKLANMTWQSPIALSSGHVGFADYLDKISGFPWQHIGAISLKSTTNQSRTGNAEKRVTECPNSLLNAVGLENPGIEKVIEEYLPQLPQQPICWIANIAGSSVEEYQQVAQSFELTRIDAIEVNISCPNVKRGGTTFGNNPKMAQEVIAAVRSVTSKPVIAKLSPNQTHIEKTAEHCIQAGANVLSAINTVSGMMIDTQTKKTSLANGIGGLSGPAILPIALLNIHKVYQVTKSLNIPIIGQGGINNADDAIAMFIAGASAISLGTVLAKDTQIPAKILKSIQLYLKRHHHQHISELTGSLKFSS